MTSEEREIFIAGRDLKGEEEHNDSDDYNYEDCDPIDLNSKFLFTNAVSILSLHDSENKCSSYVTFEKLKERK